MATAKAEKDYSNAEIEFEFEDDSADCTRTFEVRGTVEAFYPGNRRGHIDNWEADEGGGVCDLMVRENGKDMPFTEFAALVGKDAIREIEDRLAKSLDDGESIRDCRDRWGDRDRREDC
jgi:hypothetical protein